MLPFIAGMLAPSLLTGMAPWLAGGIGALAGDLVDDGEVNPLNVVGGALGAGLTGGLSGLMGTGSNAAQTAAMTGTAGQAAQGAAASLTPGMGTAVQQGLGANVTGLPAATGAKAAGGLGGLLNNPGMIAGGAALLGAIPPKGGKGVTKEKEWKPQAKAPGAPTSAAPPPGYIPGYGPEWDYGIQSNVARDNLLKNLSGYNEGGSVQSMNYLAPSIDTGGGIGSAMAKAAQIQSRYMGGEGMRGTRFGDYNVPEYTPIDPAPDPVVDRGNIVDRLNFRRQRRLGLAEGGEVTPQMPEVQAAISAIMGQHPNPQAAMGDLYAKLVERYGPERADQIIRDLVAQVQGGGGSRVMPEAGGPDGMADDQMAMVDGAEPARINSGELVVSRPDLAAMGSGDPDKGIEKMNGLIEDVRQEHYGSKKHPKRVDFEGIAGLR